MPPVKSVPCGLRERGIDGQTDIIARIRAQQRAQGSHMRDIQGHAAEFLPRRLLHACRAVALRLIACHGCEHAPVWIGARTVRRTLREHAPLSIHDAPTLNVLLHQRRARIEGMSGKHIPVPDTQLCEIENLNAEQCEQEYRSDCDMLSEFPISHPPPPCSRPRAPSICR